MLSAYYTHIRNLYNDLDDSNIRQKISDKLYKTYKNKYNEDLIDSKVKEKLYQQGFDI